MSSKSIIPTVMCRHSHNSTCPVTGQYIIAYPDRNLFIIQRIYSIRTCKYTTYSPIRNSFTFCPVFNTFQIIINSSFLFRGNNLFYIFTLRSQYHKRNTENSIGTCCKNSKFHIRIYYFKLHFRTLTATYPVFLGFL